MLETPEGHGGVVHEAESARELLLVAQLIQAGLSGIHRASFTLIVERRHGS